MINAYPAGADATKQNIKVWEQKAKGQQEEFNGVARGQQDMMTTILRQCDEPTKAQAKAHPDFATIMDEGRVLNFIKVF